MNQTDLINILHREYGLPKNLAEKILKTILSNIVLNIRKGDLVSLRNFDTFVTRMSRGKTRAKFYASKNIFKYYGKEETKIRQKYKYKKKMR